MWWITTQALSKAFRWANGRCIFVVWLLYVTGTSFVAGQRIKYPGEFAEHWVSAGRHTRVACKGPVGMLWLSDVWRWEMSHGHGGACRWWTWRNFAAWTWDVACGRTWQREMLGDVGVARGSRRASIGSIVSTGHCMELADMVHAKSTFDIFWLKHRCPLCGLGTYSLVYWFLLL